MSDPDPPPRVRVTGPPRRRTQQRSRTADIDDQTTLGTVLIGSLLGSQLRLALLALAPIVVFAAGLPLFFYLAPGLADVSVLGVPVAWVLLGAIVYPLLVACGWWYVRAAERTEREFSDLVDR